MSEEELIGRIRQGDTAALAEFIQARRPQLLAYITRQLSDALARKVEPEDLLQEASGEAVRSLETMDLSERDPFGWLCQLAQRKIIDAHRKYFAAQKRDAGREVSIDAPAGGSGSSDGGGGIVNLLVASMTTASAAVSREQKHVSMLEALEQLPEEQREALRLRYVEGLPSKEIAERLGKSDGAVRVMLTRSLSRLQAMLGPDAAPRQP